MKNRMLFLASTALLLLLSAFNNCAGNGGTTTGNPIVDVRIASYDPTAKVTKISTMSVQSLKMCFKRLRFKQLTTSPDDNIDLALNEVTVSPSGTALTSVEIPEGTYTRVEFDLDDNCGSGHSIEIQNSNGTFSTTDHTTIRFDGTFTVSGASVSLDLNIQAITSALNTVTADSQIRGKAEGASGSF